MPDAYDKWLGEVRNVLNSINMRMDDWQGIWHFDFRSEYDDGSDAKDAAAKANRFWWHEQNKSLKRDCAQTANCWLPRGHQGSCEPI
jgi:hypothetical protein